MKGSVQAKTRQKEGKIGTKAHGSTACAKSIARYGRSKNVHEIHQCKGKHKHSLACVQAKVRHLAEQTLSATCKMATKKNLKELEMLIEDGKPIRMVGDVLPKCRSGKHACERKWISIRSDCLLIAKSGSALAS